MNNMKVLLKSGQYVAGAKIPIYENDEGEKEYLSIVGNYDGKFFMILYGSSYIYFIDYDYELTLDNIADINSYLETHQTNDLLLNETLMGRLANAIIVKQNAIESTLEYKREELKEIEGEIKEYEGKLRDFEMWKNNRK